MELIQPRSLDDEHAVAGQVLGHVAEAAHLLRLGQQREERIEHEVHQPEAPVDGDVGEVAEGHRQAVAP